MATETSEETGFYYSNKYEDDEYEYRHVHVPWLLRKSIPERRQLRESEWRALGIQQSPGWEHYLTNKRVLCFRRPLPNQSIDASEGIAEQQEMPNKRRDGRRG
ncbi:hypothetical protein PRIPAC_74364 [Pristionchus pacificus]|uniref:Cyclin-dependent kinases regulatory subunit n=1 Tax=Pristionchus pacificus TaxID=54126 RepID=A0A454Y363_PRIPA|nr:hypothetical protein PRIPAC_74364 [Pristionchus pacificus]|eukprot:PDM81205.1 hypothetical protein PRIPAC_36208 [Pristionchus pacificus]